MRKTDDVDPLNHQDIPQVDTDNLLEMMAKWRKQPRLFLKEALGLTKIWKMQIDLLNTLPTAMKERKEIYVASGHACGKDFISAAISQWFLFSFMPSIVVLTGPTDRQVRNIMWKEVQGHWGRRKIDLGGRIYTDPLIKVDKDWFLTGFTTKESGATKEGGGGKFQGIHSPNVCVIVTEAQSIENEIYDQIDAITTSENVLVIFIGNPTRAKGRFAEGLKDKKKNIVFNFSCLENPNYIERRTVIPGLCSYEWVEKMREKWGEEDPRWIGRVLGQVPNISINSVFSEKLINQMSARHGFLASHSSIRGVSVDPAGEGVDENIFMSGSGGEVIETFARINMTPSEQAMQAVRMCRKINGSFIIVDCDGIGIGCYQELKKFPDDFMRGITVIKFHGSAPSTLLEGGKKIYANIRAQAAFTARDRGHRGAAAVNNKDLELVEELEADEYFENNRGEIQILPKEEIKEKIDGRSPGRRDAWVMLQYAFEQDVEADPYQDTETERQMYGLTDDDGRPDRPGVQSYGVTE